MTSFADDPCRGGLLPLETALTRILAAIEPLDADEWLDLRLAAGRILARDVHAPTDLPAFTNAAMDGYAVVTAELAPETPLTLVGRALAGKPFAGTLRSGQCVRIFTGAAVPRGADAVVMQEAVRREGNRIYLQHLPQSGENIRPAGGDVRRGERVLRRGDRLAAAQLGLLAALGISTVRVFQRPRVAYFSSGDELTPLGTPLAPGRIYDSNRYSLYGLLHPLPVAPVDLGRQPDDRERLAACLAQAGEQFDVVVSTGGASVGEADLLRQALTRVGELHLWRIAVKPGKPLIFGRIRRAWYFGLPGNPVSVHVTFSQIVRPALWRLAGGRPFRPLRLQVPCRNRLRKAAGRLEFQRGRLILGGDGNWQVEGLAGQGSHQLTTLAQANCYIVLPAESTGADPGDVVEVEPFETSIFHD